MEHLTVAEAAGALHLSVPTIKRYIYEGRLRSVKLPGGQHRIAATEIQRLLAREAPPGSEGDAGVAADGVPALERRVAEIQAEVEGLTAALEVVAHYCSRRSEPMAGRPGVTQQAAGPGPVLLVLGPGCRPCDALAELAAEALLTLGRPDVSLCRVEHLDDIITYGPVITPALALGGKVILSGRLPGPAALLDLLREHLPAPAPG